MKDIVVEDHRTHRYDELFCRLPTVRRDECANAVAIDRAGPLLNRPATDHDLILCRCPSRAGREERLQAHAALAEFDGRARKKGRSTSRGVLNNREILATDPLVVQRDRK